MFHAASLGQIRAVLRFVDEQKLPKLVLVGGDDAWRVADELKARNIAVITGAPADLPARRDEAYDETFSLPAKLHAAGVRFCIGDGRDHGRRQRAQPALPRRRGRRRSACRARRRCERSPCPAQILGVADLLGSIEVGKIADLIVTDGDPLEIATRIEQVYIAGKAVSMETRQTRLFEKYDHRPRGPKARPRTATP